MLTKKPALLLVIQEYILNPKSNIEKQMIAKGGPFLSANNPQKTLKTTELIIVTISPTLIR